MAEVLNHGHELCIGGNEEERQDVHLNEPD